MTGSPQPTQDSVNFFLQGAADYIQNLPSDRNFSVIQDVQGVLTNMSGQIANQSNSILTKQKDVLSILQNENDRLKTKKASIDDAWASRQRLIQLNDNYIKRNFQYIKMFIAVMVIFLTIMVLNVLEVGNGIFIVVLSFVSICSICYCIVVYKTLITRSSTDFDKLNLPKPDTNTAAQDAAAARNAIADAKSPNGMDLTFPDSLSLCANQSCCAPGTHWVDASGACYPGADSFVSNRIVDGSGGIVPASTSSNYALYM